MDTVRTIKRREGESKKRLEREREKESWKKKRLEEGKERKSVKKDIRGGEGGKRL